MAISYQKLMKLLEPRGMKLYLRKNGISSSILNKIKHELGGLDARTIEKICKLLDCQPGDIMEYVPDESPDCDK